MTFSTCLLLRKIPRLLIAIFFPRDLHWDRDDPLKLVQVTLLATRRIPMHWYKHPTLPVATIEFGLLCRPILEELAPCALRTIG